MKKLIKLINITPLMLLAACSGNDVQQTLGLAVDAPDEFMVMKHPPLEQPKDFSRLPKPGDTPGNLASKPITEAARKTLYGSSGINRKSTSKGENALLNKADANKVDPNIRRKLYAEQQAAVQKRLEREDSTLGSLDPWNAPERDPILDAEAEQKRIKEALESGKTISSEGVEEKSRMPKAPLEGIFN